VPTVGEFRNGRREFFDQESYGGRSREVNWIATDTRTARNPAAAH